ncbi:DUF4975 domain-containing protein [Pedobacter aquae]|uniref:beta-fructofuranosidase n=1 Tax=Pedobacter aquae TaxID=2605747 RepID=A0A5C0VLT4_9SPHI|nr:glycoside hydrolase family 32 protein [Pedobacter aquae]QEK53117.1 DUF4975 domain-containing protein [Pedobacter aquae]
MMKKVKLTMILTGIALLTSCAKQKESAPVITNPVVADEVTIFPKPTPAKSSTETGYVGWIGDVMPYYFNNQFEIFFLHDATDQVKQLSKGQHPIHRFTTKDFLKFNYEGEAIAYSTADQQDQLIGTGSIVKHNQLYYCYYTGHNGSVNWISSNPREAVMYATSTDLKTWTKKNTFKLVAPIGYSSFDFRDPSVFYNEEFKEYWMMVSTQKSNKAVILVFTTKDLASDNWAIRGTLPIDNDNYLMMECAEIFKSGSKYYLLFAENWSATPGTRYRVANSTEGPWTMPVAGNDMFDGHQFYAGRSVSNGTQIYTMGWAHRRNPETNTGTLTWGGNLVTHELYTLSNGNLAVKLPASVLNYFNSETDAVVKNKSGNAVHTGTDFMFNGTGSIMRFNALNKTTMIKGSIKLAELNGSLIFGLNAKDDNTGSYTIKIEPQKNRIAGYNNNLEITRVSFKFTANTVYNFKLVMEKSVAILYINDEVALTNRVYNLNNNLWTISAEGINATVRNIKIATHK